MRRLLILFAGLLAGCTLIWGMGYGKERAAPPVKAPNPPQVTNNDVMSFIYKWFAAMDHQEGADFFLDHLSSTGLEVRLPSVTIHSPAEFKKWYEQDQPKIKRNVHEVKSITLSGNARRGFNVDLRVQYMAVTQKGENLKETYHQTWKIEVAPDNKLIVTRYVVEKL